MTQLSNENIRKEVREQYAKVALSGGTVSCCTATSCGEDSAIDVKLTSKSLGYSNKEVSEVPIGANMGLGCGNPQAVAALKIGETVLDLGSGGGFDCFLAAKQVGESGHVIGVDMTSEMLSKARKNSVKNEYNNVEFRLGEIENLPVPDVIIDVIISNCVINLSPEKARVFEEAFRVLKPGGRLAISDVVAFAELPEKLKTDMALFTGCMAGASQVSDLEDMLINAGFKEIEIKPKDKSREFIRNWVPDSKIENFVVSATIEAFKPTT